MLTREITYIVQPGDTIYLIAKKFNTSVEAIVAANNLAVPALIYPGQILRIPVTGVEYIVQPGDTVYSIATKFGVPYYTIIYVNNIMYPYTIYPGQRLFIPTMSPITYSETTIEEQSHMPPYPIPCQYFYTVKPGDSMWSIANMFGIPLDCLIKANPHIHPNKIYPGQILCIPAYCPPAPPSPCKTYYTVKPGDSMWTIANMFGIPLDCLIKANPHIPDPSKIYPGQVLCIPAYCPPAPHPPAPCQCQTYYTVKAGDSMWSIAKKFGISLDALIKANPQIPDPSKIYPGQILCIPADPPSQQEIEKSKETETEKSE
ncbi:spore coat assembly protein SafA [Caldanaerobius fijiensis DSM 17918]|uniref:Spore coat assembly protein SafA n=1 Tax=Caldanaerobius fijiensis DSM 17918 TaxID=1121256 RepID=A0A1M5A5K1_9THEO|nr:SafA/ExsA family spore coat assembly protein [Caldanaerobius fijiensis]SHF25550.1 spore coat assembly protein SafA [Caldanaerobius fijiensis DSM 17918]